MMAETIDISGFNHKNQAEVMASLKNGIEEKGSGEWVLAYGWDPAILRDLEAPTLEELDRMAPENPLFIIAQTLHSGFVNSLALLVIAYWINVSRSVITQDNISTFMQHHAVGWGIFGVKE
jgi:predicted amidohydrolase YtcJ